MFRIGLNRGAAAAPLTARLPWAYFAEQGVVFLKFGGFMRTLKFRGPDSSSMTDDEIDVTMIHLHDALRRVRGKMSLHIEARRRLAAPYPGHDLTDEENRQRWADPVSYLWNEERRDAYDAVGAHYETDRYVTFVWKCSRASTQRARDFFMTRGSSRQVGVHREFEEFLQACNLAKVSLDGLMAECDWLDDDQTFDYLHKTVSVNTHKVKPSYGKARIDYDVADSRVVGGADPMLGDCYMRTISVKNAPDTIPVAMAALDGLPFEHRYTVRWQGMEQAEGLKRIERQLADWDMLGVKMARFLASYIMKSDKQQVNHAANSMSDDARQALMAARSDELTMGCAAFNVVLWAPTLALLDEREKKVREALSSLALTLTNYSVAPIDTWLGTLPGHIYADLRRPIRTSVNLAHFMPYSSVWSGPLRNEHLSEKLGKEVPPLMVTTTGGTTPFRLSLHTLGDLGHTLLFGPSGTGKTTVLNGLIASYQQIPRAKSIIFTIKGGGEIVTRLLGGVSYNVGSVEPGELGFQPLAHADEPNERIELLDWVLSLLRDQGINTKDTAVRAEVTAALDMISANLVHRRTLTHLSGYLTTAALKEAIRHYAMGGGNYGCLLDDDKDSIALADVVSFDMTELLKKQEVAPHVLAHLFRYVERRIFTGDPVLLVVDEAWRFLGDALFTAKFEEWLRAARSKGVVVVFATQNMKDAFNDTIGQVIADTENVPNIILLPNKKARSEKGRRPYEQLGFNAADIEIVSRAYQKKQYYFTCPLGRRLFDFRLGPLGVALCASTSTDDLNLAHRIAAESPNEFAERYLEEKGLRWAAEYLRNERAARGDDIEVTAMAAE